MSDDTKKEPASPAQPKPQPVRTREQQQLGRKFRKANDKRKKAAKKGG